MVDWKDPDLWMKIIQTGLGAAEARDKSKNTISPKDMWNLGNPSVNTPFYNTQTSWNQGSPTEDRQMSPNLQQAFDEIIWGALAQGRDPYQMNNNMGRLQNLQEQNQLGRYGQRGDPYSPKPEAGGRQSYDPVSTLGNGQDDDDSPNYRTGDNYQNAGLNRNNYMDEIQRSMMSNQSNQRRMANDSRNYDMMDNMGLGWMNPDSGIPYMDNYGGYGSDGDPTGWQAFQDYDWGNASESFIKEMIPWLASSATGLPITEGMTEWAGLDDSDWWGQQQGMMNPNSSDFVPPPQDTGRGFGGGQGANFGGGFSGNYGMQNPIMGGQRGRGDSGIIGGNWGSGGIYGGGMGIDPEKRINWHIPQSTGN